MVSSRLKELLELRELGREKSMLTWLGSVMVTGRIPEREEAEDVWIILPDKLRQL